MFNTRCRSLAQMLRRTLKDDGQRTKSVDLVDQTVTLVSEIENEETIKFSAVKNVEFHDRTLEGRMVYTITVHAKYVPETR